jgi:DNA-binding transcriptional LysR family regulator
MQQLAAFPHGPDRSARELDRPLIGAKSGRRVRILEDHQPVEVAINAIYPHRHHLSTKVRSFIDLVAERIAEHRKTMDLTAVG